MENRLKFGLLLSLKEMALRRVAVLLWGGYDISVAIWEIPPSLILTIDGKDQWRKTIEDKIKDKTLTLELPKSLMKQMIALVKPISSEIRLWKAIHQREKFFPAKLCWTTAGKIDDRRTFQELVHCDKMNVVRRYEIACSKCLEDSIPFVWEELPEDKKNFYYSGRPTGELLPFCWSHILYGEQSVPDSLRAWNRNVTSINQLAFEHSVALCNKMAAEYFFQKLTHKEREASLMRTALDKLANPQIRSYEDEILSDVLCYLLSVMSPEQQMEAIKANPLQVLLCFLGWPKQDLLLANAGLVWPFLSRSSYEALVQKVLGRYDKSSFPKFFQEFFKQSPLDFKNFFVDADPYGIQSWPACLYLSTFIQFEDSESLKVLFRNMDAADRVKLVFCRRTLKLFHGSLLRDRWHMVEVCLQEAFLSTEEKKKLKDVFIEMLSDVFLPSHLLPVIERNREIFRKQCGNPKLKCFYDFLDETNGSADKEKKGLKRKLENCSLE